MSGPRVGARLAADGHDVRPVDQERELDGCSDEMLLALSTSEDCVLVTSDVGDFAQIAQRWAAEARPHTGLILLVEIGHHELGGIVDALRRSLAARPNQADWRDRVTFAGRPGRVGPPAVVA